MIAKFQVAFENNEGHTLFIYEEAMEVRDDPQLWKPRITFHDCEIRTVDGDVGMWMPIKVSLL